MRFLILALGLVFMLSLVSCNTMEGLGKDMQKVGEKIEKKAEQKGAD